MYRLNYGSNASAGTKDEAYDIKLMSKKNSLLHYFSTHTVCFHAQSSLKTLANWSSQYVSRSLHLNFSDRKRKFRESFHATTGIRKRSILPIAWCWSLQSILPPNACL